VAEGNKSALILGASSGFGEASALALAEAGFDIYGVHLDRRAGLERVKEIVAEIEALGRRALFFNLNAADAEKRADVLDRIGEETAPGAVRVLLHSLAFGTLRPLVDRDPKSVITPKQMDMTLDVMSHSLVYWTQGLVSRRLMGDGGRIYAMTSSGGDRVSPFYGPVSAAKASLESHCRQLALELAPLGITCNAIRAGVTDTPALRKIPGHDRMIEIAREINPHGRLTTPADIGRCLVALSRPETAWMTGNVLRVDGGEDVVGAGLSSGPDTVAGVSGDGS
jgi:NAD(P)-dependent dehydrogenase (short-subunit alcohol dehydrogenase family)